MTEIEGRICSNFRQSKNKREQIEIDAIVYNIGEDEILDILERNGYDVVRYKIKNNKKDGKSYKLNENIAEELYKQGLNDVEIAKKLCVCRATVAYWRGKNNLQANFKNYDEITSKIPELLEKGYTINKISRVLRISEYLIYKYKREHNIYKSRKKAAQLEL